MGRSPGPERSERVDSRWRRSYLSRCVAAAAELVVDAAPSSLLCGCRGAGWAGEDGRLRPPAAGRGERSEPP